MKRRVKGFNVVRAFWMVLAACSLSALILFGRWDAETRDGHRHSGTGGEDAMMRDWEYRRALQHEGTGGRMQAFLQKAMAGKPFTVSVIGGSVSKGRGLSPSPVHQPSTLEGDLQDLTASTLYSSENMHTIIFDYLNATFPHPENRFVNGAQGGVGSSYFGWCFKEHIPEDSDLVLVELGINDLQEMEVIRSFEHLIRGVLELKSQPAIVNIETFTTLFPTLLNSASLHLDVLTFYDVPSISIRDVLLPRIERNPDEQLPKWFRTGGDVELGDAKVREWGGRPVDLMHISSVGHQFAAGLVTRYITDQLERSHIRVPSIISWGRWAAGNMRRATTQIVDVPSAGLTYKFGPKARPEPRNPQCRSMNSPTLHSAISGDVKDDSASGVKGLRIKEENSGWMPWSWKEKSYMVALAPGSTISMDFITLLRSPTSSKHLHARQFPSTTGSVHIGYQRSATYGLGSVECWVDGNKAAKKRIDGYWDLEARNMGVVTEVANGLQPGPHTLHCELLRETLDPSGGHEFRLFAIMHD